MFTKSLVVLAVAGSALGQMIQTPASLVECQPASLTFTGGTGPYILAAIPGGQVSAPSIETISSGLTSSPYTWNVNLASGTNITLKITDSTGLIGYSSPLVIQPGSSNACLNSTASTAGVATTGAITTTATGSMTTASGTTSAMMTTSTTSLMMSTSAMSSAPSSSAAAASKSASSAASTPVSSTTPSASAAATTSAKASGAFATAVIGVPAIALAVVGGLALLL